MVTNHDRKSFGLHQKNYKSCSDDSPLMFLSAIRHFRTHFAESFRMSKYSWMMDPNHSHEMLICSGIDLAEIRRSQDWPMNLINNLRSGHCFGSSRTRHITGGKITTFKSSHPVLTVAYDGACSPNVSFRMAWISFGALPCRKRNLMTARVSMLLKSRASPDMLPFSLCNNKRLAVWHMNRPPLSNDTIDSILRHREVGWAKDLIAPPLKVTLRYVHATIVALKRQYVVHILSVFVGLVIQNAILVLYWHLWPI